MTVTLLAMAVLAAPPALGQPEAPAPQLPVLLLNGAIYTQEYDAGGLPPAFTVDAYPAQMAALHMVQCEGPVKEVWVEDLRSIGGEPRGYLPYNTLLVVMDGDARSRLSELEFVTWDGIYQPYFKISPALQLRLAQGGDVMVLAELFSPRLLAATVEALQGLDVEVIAAQGDAWGAVAALRMPVDKVSGVAALPAVEWMELCTVGELPAARTGALDTGLSGAALFQTAGSGGETVAVMDTGIGSGGLQGLPEPLAGKVTALESLRGDDGGDVNGHGTAVAGRLLGFPSAQAAAAAPPGFTVLAYATAYGLDCPPQPLSLYSLLDDAYGRGARVFLSGSVPEGKESLGAYGIFTMQRDAFIWENPSMLVVEAAGNEGTDADGNGSVDQGSLLGGAAAKNALSVGGCESATAAMEGEPALRNYELEPFFQGKFPAAPLRDDESVGAPTGIAAFSSRGPTRDGRIKPDLVAACTDVAALSPGTAVAVPGILPSSTPGGVRAYGTSMAAALATAAAASMRAPLAGVQEAEPSAALLKAFLVNGAEELSPGQYGKEAEEIPQAPNVVEGWGRLDREGFNRTSSWAKVLDDKEGMRLGESRVFRLEVASGTQLRVTLAWSDYPSMPQARLHLVNDLDLRVLDPDGNTYYPNARNSRDPLNNAERVSIEVAGKPGTYTIELNAWNVPFSPQPFALVAQVM
ncbi:MAG: S8 family serine peptidase [Actinomycetota bacterium]